MKRFSGKYVCMALGSVLLSSLGFVCVAFQKIDKIDTVDILLNDESLSLQTPAATASADAHGTPTLPAGTSLNTTLTTNGELQPHARPLDHNVLTGNQTIDIQSSTLSMATVEPVIYRPSVEMKEFSEGGRSSSTAASSLPPATEVTVPSATISTGMPRVPTTNDPSVYNSLEGPLFTKGAEEQYHDHVFDHPTVSLFNTEEMLVTNPRTNSVQTGPDYSTVSLLFVDHSENTEQDVFISSIVSAAQFTTVTSIRAEPATDVTLRSATENEATRQSKQAQTFSASPVPKFTEDWDDTKLLPTSQVKFTRHDRKMSVSTALHETEVIDPELGPKGLLFTNPTDVTSEKIEEKVYSGTQESLWVATAERGTPADFTGRTSHLSNAALTDGAGVAPTSIDMLGENISHAPLPDAISHTVKEVNDYKEGEDDEEGEEEEDDEEEEEEDKDADSMDDSVEGDTELPAFTLPIVSSQDPLGGKKSQQQLEAVSYQVPDTLAWEQQNQGLVRSWMEKLKDKGKSPKSPGREAEGNRCQSGEEK